MMLIYAPNIHTSGGKVLLEALLTSSKSPVLLFSDARFTSTQPLSENIQRVSVSPSIVGRLKAEFELRQKSRDAKVVLCFGNLPPLFRLSAKTVLFFQNTILLKKYSNFPFSGKVRLKHRVERYWLAWGLKYVHKVFVQSLSVREDFLHEFPNKAVHAAPFLEALPTKNTTVAPGIDFVYVATGEPHKNHLRLFKAWELLAKQNLYPSLGLTLSKNSHDLLGHLTELQIRGLKITNHPDLDRSLVLDLYRQSRALIFPSLTESFGLPLLEAQALGLPIVASELDFVREFVTPVQTFDPQSEKSISRAVQRFLGNGSAAPQQKVCSPQEFLNLIQS